MFKMNNMNKDKNIILSLRLRSYFLMFMTFLTVFVPIFIYGYYDSNERLNAPTRINMKGLYLGWVPNRLIDLSDHQWRNWRRNLPLLSMAMISIVTLNYIVKRVLIKNQNDDSKKLDHLTSNSYFNFNQLKNQDLQVLYWTIVIFIFFFVIHKFTFLYLIIISIISFSISFIFKGSNLNPILTWLFNLSILITSHYYSGYRLFSYIGFDWIDEDRGMLDWDTYFKMGMLKLISYNMDYYWFCNNQTVQLSKKKMSDYTKRVITPLPHQCYSFKYFFLYIFYVPLYLAGPITSFNAFISYIAIPQKEYSPKQILIKFIWIIIVTIGFEFMLHFNYLYTYNITGLWINYTPRNILLIGMWSMMFLYLKLLCIWRFFRVIALMDGVDTPENMLRCMANNYSFVGFWRGWHASFNKWTVRYLYVPLGGKKTQRYTLWLIFFFIGIWHDLWWEWICWALFNCIFFTCEIIITISYQKYLKKNKENILFVILRNIVVVSNIILLLITNLAIIHGFRDIPNIFYYGFLSKSSIIPVLWVYMAFTFGYNSQILYRKLENLLEASKKC
eukprot:TRINITY_DN7011_c0_g1_i1.p1 TRINITY_DN7011_c0_g1~~TRINITY_DN7011_c0_g1_i1.p1  ORF type:complete len:559 (+),score=55.03 TRINITY_DN7011_c0_g1_i1:33-1709(+)